MTISIILTVAGLFFFIAGIIGLIRFPDVYTRMHSLGKCDTLGLVLTLCGLAIYNGWSLVTIKILCIALFVFLTGPVVTHILAKAAYESGLKPWTRKE